MTTISTNGDYICEEYDEDWSDEDYEYDEDDNDYEYDEYEEKEFCGEKGCLSEAIDTCQCCGKSLCVMHSEIGAGFCRECPTQEWIEEQDNMR